MQLLATFQLPGYLQWCHWFWCQAESYYGKYVFNTPFALRDFVGVSDIESPGPYVKTQWRDYQAKLLGN
ncbi:MAG: hypothetical protein NWE91_01225 [Candidatus Bathyarchaeota archaeon]|nr:hypothetical protein [Candidatus Bathyarchaeota archaeon]